MANKSDDARTRNAADGVGGGKSLASSISFRVATLLELVAFREDGVGPREAARETGIDRSAVSRIFRQLEATGWVEEVDERGTYSVGPRMFSVAAAVRQRDSLWRAAEPILKKLVAEHDETAYLAVRQGDNVVFREKIESTQRIRYVLELNTAHPLTTGAAGRAILSALPQDDVERVLAQGLVRYTPSSVMDPDKYREQLERDRKLGYAYSASWWVPRGGGVGAPFFDASGVCLGSLTISAPIDRLGASVAAKIGASVLGYANVLSHRLGWDGHWGP